VHTVVGKASSYALRFEGSRLEFAITQGFTTRRVRAAAGAIVVGSTYHLVGVYDGSALRLYINGVQVASSSVSGSIRTNSNALFIGSSNGSSQFFRGTIDEVAVYSTALTATQVANHRTAGTTP
jgi:hypothetical protein